MTHIRILLCTLNGADYLSEQLASFVRQDHSDWSLWVSDDGSTDNTLDILNRFAIDHPHREIRLLCGPGAGSAQNFLSLLCHPDLPEDHVALSDQDDVWMDGKLTRALKVMGRADSTRPVLYAGQSVIAAADLTPKAVSSDSARPPEFRNALVQNLFAGHSTMLNPAALAVVRQAGCPADVPYHDWWLYLLLSGAGAQCLLDQTAVVAWRQHDGNSIGSASRLDGLRHRAGVMWSGRYLAWMDTHTLRLSECAPLLTEETQTLLAHYAAARVRFGPARALAYTRLGLRRQTIRGTTLFIALTALGRA
jgi:glycosyltransferase involved in cell wall biosynthesis